MIFVFYFLTFNFKFPNLFTMTSLSTKINDQSGAEKVRDENKYCSLTGKKCVVTFEILYFQKQQYEFAFLRHYVLFNIFFTCKRSQLDVCFDFDLNFWFLKREKNVLISLGRSIDIWTTPVISNFFAQRTGRPSLSPRRRVNLIGRRTGRPRKLPARGERPWAGKGGWRVPSLTVDRFPRWTFHSFRPPPELRKAAFHFKNVLCTGGTATLQGDRPTDRLYYILYKWHSVVLFTHFCNATKTFCFVTCFRILIRLVYCAHQRKTWPAGKYVVCSAVCWSWRCSSLSCTAAVPRTGCPKMDITRWSRLHASTPRSKPTTANNR